MATKEGSTTSNPVRLRIYGKDKITFDTYAAVRAFKNQTPGLIILDTATKYFKCTRFKTSLGEPIWAQITEGGTNQGNYSIYVNYVDGNSRAINSIKTSYKDPQLIARRLKDKQSTQYVGYYFFQKLSSAELKRIQSNVNYDKIAFMSDGEVGDFLDQGFINVRALQAINEAYDYMNKDTNGRSGVGSTAAVPQATEEEQASPTGSSTPSAAPTTSSGVNGSGKGTTGNTGATKNANTAGGSSKTTTGSSSGVAKTNIVLKPDKKIYTGSNDFTLPYMKQMINHFNTAENARQRIERIHVFEMIPNSFEFSQLSSTWNEVARSGNYPLVDWSNYNLTKVSFRFLVVARKLEVNQFYSDAAKTNLQKQTSSIVNDGLLVSVDDQLDNIRAMVGAPAPITLYNLNTLISTEYRYPYTNNTRNMQWIIGDASITATRLTEHGQGISAAEVSMTLTEYPVVSREIIPLPPLTPDNPPPPPCKPSSGDPKCQPADPTYGLWVENTYKYLNLAKDYTTYPTGKPD